MWKKLKFYAGRLFFFLLVVSLGLLLTGNPSRDYTTLATTSTVQPGNRTLSLAEFARAYRPVLLHDTARPHKVYYEVVEEKNTYILTYYFAWKSEQHPNVFLNLARHIGRLIYFRFQLTDIAYLQVNVSKRSGEIASAKTDLNKIEKPTVPLLIEVVNWKHDLLLSKEGNSPTPVEYSLHPMDDSTYRSLKMARRSHGDYHTRDNIMNYPFIVFLALIATYYLRHLQKDYNNEYTNKD